MNGSSNRWTIAGPMLAMLLVPTAVVIGVIAGASGPDGPDRRPAPVAQRAAPGSTGISTKTASQPTVDQDDRLDAHQVMLEQMRVSVTPQMIQTMNAEPLVHSPADLAQLERHAAEIDRMLARNP